MLFLTPPAQCGGAGYPSSSRAFEPDFVPAISLYYGHNTVDEEDAPSPSPCNKVGEIQFLGAPRPICEERESAEVRLVVQNRYQVVAAGDAEAVFTLVTTADRLVRDRPVFVAAAANLRTCSFVLRGVGAKKRTRWGVGPSCLADGRWF
ncbi:hypothetical protein [Sphingomonas elodea]|uniref:hypothetical protein n=1 Tax=Sphingomonas elodea TaxID=179878 RepID=UPI0011107018|nr:hypothetical protein [Sphingomonas elodea]